MAYLAVADGTGHRLGWTNKKGEYHGSPGDGLTPVIFASRKYRFGENNVAGEFLDGMPIFAEDSLWPATYREINDAYRIQCLNADKEIAVKTDSNGHTHALIMGIAKKSKGADDRAAGDSVKANIALLEKIADWMAEDSAANLHIASPEELAEIAGSIAKIEVAIKTAQKITNGIVE